MITRELILQTLYDALKPIDAVQAMWQGGAASFNRVDEWSDIDLQLDVDDEMVEQTFEVVETALESIAPIQFQFRLPEPTWHGHSQCFYRLQDASEFLMLDLVVIRHSNSNKFLQPETHGKPVVAFDKNGVVQWEPLDLSVLDERLRSRQSVLQVNLELFRSTVLKELNRGNTIEAVAFYQGIILRQLIEVLRIKYVPARSQFHARYIHYDLPKEIVARLEPLFFICSADDLRAKFSQAEQWIREVLSDLKGNN
jgi:hypothetical protein